MGLGVQREKRKKERVVASLQEASRTLSPGKRLRLDERCIGCGGLVLSSPAVAGLRACLCLLDLAAAEKTSPAHLVNPSGNEFT